MRHFLRSLLAIPLGIQAWTPLPPYPTGMAFFQGNGSELVAYDRLVGGNVDPLETSCKRRISANSWEAIRCVESLRGTLGVVVEEIPDSPDSVRGRAVVHVERIGSGIRHGIPVLPEVLKLLDHDEDRLLVAGDNQLLFVVRVPQRLPTDSLEAREQIQVRLRSGPGSADRSEWADVVGGRLDGAHMLVWTRTANWTSRDSGTTWTRTPLPPFRDAAIDGANLVAITAASGTLHSSRDGGVTWDTGGTVGAGAPRGIRFLGHRLFGEFTKDGMSEIARSDDLGRLWSTVLVGGRVSQLALLHNELWASGLDGAVRSRDGGRSWIPADSALPFTGDTWKIRARGTEVLVGRHLYVSDSRPWSSLWGFEGGRWRKIRDSVTNFELDAPWQGGRIHVITGEVSGSYRLTSSTDLVSWSQPFTAQPWFSHMAVDRGLVVVGQKFRASRATMSGGWQALLAWSETVSSPDPFVVWNDRVVWSERNASQDGNHWVESSTGGPKPLFPSAWAVGAIAPLDDSTLVAVVDGVVGRVHRGDSLRFEPLLSKGAWSLSDHGGSVLAYLHEGTQFHRITRDSVETIAGPKGVRIAGVRHLPARPFDPLSETTDSGYLVLDSTNVLHWSGRVAPAGVRTRAKAGIAPLEVRGSALFLEIAEAADVALEVFDVRGSRTSRTRILRLPAGRHRIPTESGGSGRFARVRIGDEPPRTLRLPLLEGTGLP